MMSLRRPLALLAAATALSVAVSAQSLEDTFNQGVELYQRGNSAAALKKFQECLAMDPGHDAAYELFKATEHDIWLKLMVEGGEYELVAKRLMSLAEIGRKERMNDPDAIRALVGELNTDDVLKRVATVRKLAADHGEYAVPVLLYALGDPDDDDRRVLHMQALTDMGADVVLPLTEALHSTDPFLRRNVALTLGYVGDPRAAGMLAAVAATDADDGARAAASESVTKVGGSGNALGQLLALGNAYHAADPTVLMPHQISDVVWTWTGSALEPTEVPDFLYNEELAKKSFYAALAVSPGSTEALAGIARASVAQHQELAARAAAGGDVSAWQERLAEDDLAIQVAGTQALDLALLWALDTGDDAAASGLCRALGRSASRPTQGLGAALTQSTSGAIRGEAAVALGWIAYHSGTAASPDVVAALAEASAREVVQIAAVIDGNDTRRDGLAGALAGGGLMVNAWNSGAKGLASLHRIPGVDVLLVAETLPDLTFAQVVDEVRRDPRTENTPILVVAEDVDAATDLWGDRVTGGVTGADDLGKVQEALAGGLNSDREQANDLAARAASALSHLAGAGQTNIGAAADALAGTLGASPERPDKVILPAMGALRSAGTTAHVGALTAVLADEGRSDAAREHAGQALAGIFARNPQGASEETLTALNTVATSGATFAVRQAAATALGRLDLTAEMRASLMTSVRASVAGGE